MKNPNGFGSVCNLGKGRRKPYGVRVTVGYDFADNKARQKQIYIGYYATRKEALQALAEYNMHPFDLKAKTVTFAELYVDWSKTGLEGLAANTLKNYTSAYNKLSSIADMPIADIRTAHMQAVVDKYKGKSSQISKNVITICKRVFEYAMKHELVNKNYASYIELPKAMAPKAIHSAFTMSEIERMWKHYESGRPWPVDLALILIYTGMRPSELLEVRRENVFLEDRYLIGGTKTAASKDRIIPLHDDIVPLIEKRFNPKMEFLVNSARKKGMSYKALCDNVIPELYNLGIEHLMHDGRHTFATIAKGQIEDFYISKIMGHKLSGITESVYTHVTPAVLVEQVNKISFRK